MKKCCLGLISFFQALGVVVYCGLIGLIFWKGSAWFGKVPNFLGLFLMLLLLSTSALVCGLLVFGKPILMWFKEKKEKSAVKLVFYTVGWLIGFVLLTMGMIIQIK